MEVQLGWFYQTREGEVVRIRSYGYAANSPFPILAVFSLKRTAKDPYPVKRVAITPVEAARWTQGEDPLLILESGSWLHDLTAAWKPGDGILAERLKEAGRKAV